MLPKLPPAHPVNQLPGSVALSWFWWITHLLLLLPLSSCLAFVYIYIHYFCVAVYSWVLLFCHTPAKLRPKPSWVGCIIGFDNPNPKPKCHYIFEPLADYQGSWFSVCNLSSTQLDDPCKTKIWPTFFFGILFLTQIFFTQIFFDPNFFSGK